MEDKAQFPSVPKVSIAAEKNSSPTADHPSGGLAISKHTLIDMGLASPIGYQSFIHQTPV
jgi:hypothetical protein